MSRPPASAAEAHGLIEKIVCRNGFVSESSLETMLPEVRRKVEAALLAKDMKIGSSVLTLAKNLYTSKARFVFELLQNTDDNKYAVSKAAGHAPWVSFTLHPDKLVVDCNEDGFTEKNLSAICDIGKSSKSNSQGYIGEKGIGFKSVFMAASKVHIQSGHLSFSFIHRKGDSGMGMVNPVWEDPAGPLPRNNHTRITLFLHDSGDAEQTEREREDIRDQFRELEPAHLLFLRELSVVEITFRDEQGQQKWATRLTRRQFSEADRVILERRTSDRGSVFDVDPESHIYHVTEHAATNVARHDNRELSTSDHSGPASRQSKIVLAFPVSANSVPIIRAQKVFAFLPMKQMGFNFLIHADFVTQANREDVVTTSARNQDLIKGVIDAFINTVLQFCQHESLQYTWMRYLPREGTHHWDPFWMKLVDGIKVRLIDEFVIRTRGKRVLRRIADVKDRVSDINDQHGEPLLPDLDPEIYLASSYTRADIDILKMFGLGMMGLGHFTDCAEQDLAQPSVASRFRSPNTDDEWHIRVSKLLLLPFKNNWEAAKPRIKKLPIVPLQNGSWVRAVDGEIFYGTIGNIPIPGDLGLQIVAAKPTKNATRRELFDSLGVRSASTAMIRSRILDMHMRGNMSNVSLENSLEHLRFLYLTQRSTNEGWLELFIHDHLGQPRKPLDYDMYMRDNHPYGAQSLLGSQAMSSFDAFFVNPEYWENPPNTPSAMSLTFVEWMYQNVGVARNIRIATRDEKALSGECVHIAEHHSDKFLEFLRHVWPEQGEYIEKDESILAELRGIPVLCTNGTKAPLSTCYMPLQKLRSTQSRFSSTDILPFLDISSANDAGLLSQWSFLTDIAGVSCDDNLPFHWDLLTALVVSAGDSITVSDAFKFFDLYKSIGAYCMGSADPDRMRERVRKYFIDDALIMAPPPRGGFDDIEWATPDICLWEAPLYMETVYPLRALYEKAGLGAGLDGVRHFFQETLGIPDIDYTNVLDELKTMRQQGIGGDIDGLYRLLQGMCDADNSISGPLSDDFEEFSLVLVERGGSSAWYSPSQCLWSSTTSIDGKMAIDKQYAEFETLFTQALGVSRLTLTMVHEELLGVESSGATTEGIKKLLLDFSSLLTAEGNVPAAKRLLKRRVFPVKSPGGEPATLCSSETEFFIVDRRDLFAAFGSRVRYLDFSLKEVCHLSPFIAWAGLESRRLSRSVEEVSRVQGGVERPIGDAEKDVKRKAYALLRIAAAYRSPKFEADPQALYDILRTADTVEAGGISSTLVLHQDGRAHEHEVSKSDLHIEERGGSLKIYVPRDEGALSACLCDALPRRLLSWIMALPGSTEVPAGTSDEKTPAVVVSILNCTLSAVPKILELNGVPPVDEIDEVPDPLPEVASPPETPTRSRHLFARSPGETSSAAATPERLLSSPDDGDASYATPLTDPGDYVSDLDSSGAIRSANVRLWQEGSRESKEAYTRLLNSAVTMAERIARRDYGVADVVDVLDDLSLQDDDVFTSTPSTHDLSTIQGQKFKIGAAGELFVFVFLSSLDPCLPSFGRDNWQSTIRFHAAAHHRFTDLTSWVGNETSDIVYDDECGDLTDLLMVKGYLSNDWENKTPRYYIEVKSTLDRCETPFYVSHGQAERMRKTTNGPSGCDNQDAVYVIFRVFKLGTDATGFRIYVDPEEQRRTGRLKFKTDATYAVTPGEVD